MNIWMNYQLSNEQPIVHSMNNLFIQWTIYCSSFSCSCSFNELLTSTLQPVLCSVFLYWGELARVPAMPCFAPGLKVMRSSCNPFSTALIARDTSWATAARWSVLPVGRGAITYEAVSGSGPGIVLGPRNVYFWETYFKDQNSTTQIFWLMKINNMRNFYNFCSFHYGT